MIDKFKFRTLLTLAAAVLLASCSPNEVMTDTGHDGLVPVTLSAAVGDGVQTRTIDADNDEKPTRCYVQAFTTADNGTTLTPAPGDLARPLDMGEPTAEGTFSLANVYLNPNETYVFLYWADNAEEPASALTDLTIVAYNYTGNGNLIAWAERSEAWNYKTAGTAEISAELQHVVAKVTLKTTTNVEAGSITVTVPTTYSTYNVAAGDVIQEAKLKDTSFEHTVTNAITGTEEGTEVFSFYALVKDETQNITLTNGTNSQRVSNVPLGPNKHTTLVGDVRNLGLTNVAFTASVETTWGSTPIIGEGYEVDSEGNYTVTTAEGLKAWATAVQSNASLNCTLADNITLSEVAEGGSNWTTVRNFAGTFDGAGHTITGLTGTAGFFDKIEINGVVKNLNLEDVEITKSGCGAIARESSGTITACSVSGSVEGSSNSTTQGVGGIVGRNNEGTVSGCSMEGTVTNSGMYAGGIVGYNYGGNVIDCHSSTTVTSTNCVGGVVGRQYESNAKVIACSSTGDVTATSTENESKAGGVVRFSNGGDIICCYATGNISGKSSSVGGVVGTNRDNVVACYYANGNISGDNAVGGVVGENRTGGIITACYWSDYVGNGIGTGATNVDEATKVDGDWTEAVSKMNSVLEDYDWLWTIESPNTLPTLKKKETN